MSGGESIKQANEKVVKAVEGLISSRKSKEGMTKAIRDQETTVKKILAEVA